MVVDRRLDAQQLGRRIGEIRIQPPTGREPHQISDEPGDPWVIGVDDFAQGGNLWFLPACTLRAVDEGHGLADCNAADSGPSGTAGWLPNSSIT